MPCKTQCRLPDACLLAPAVLQPARAGLGACEGLGLSAQSMALAAHPPGWASACASLFFLSYMIIYAFFLQPCVYRSPSARLQTVFVEHRTTLDVFVVFSWGRVSSKVMSSCCPISADPHHLVFDGVIRVLSTVDFFESQLFVLLILSGIQKIYFTRICCNHYYFSFVGFGFSLLFFS